MKYRIEKDTLGEVKVPEDAYYGAQTQRSIDNFKIAQDINKMPKEIIRAFAYLKKAAAITNLEAGILTKEKEKFLHPNDDVNKSQSSNDTFPTAMHIAAYKILVEITFPGIEKLRNTLSEKSKQFMKLVK